MSRRPSYRVYPVRIDEAGEVTTLDGRRLQDVPPEWWAWCIREAVEATKGDPTDEVMARPIKAKGRAG